MGVSQSVGFSDFRCMYTTCVDVCAFLVSITWLQVTVFMSVDVLVLRGRGTRVLDVWMHIQVFTIMMSVDCSCAKRFVGIKVCCWLFFIQDEFIVLHIVNGCVQYSFLTLILLLILTCSECYNILFLGLYLKNELVRNMQYFGFQLIWNMRCWVFSGVFQ